MDSTRANDDDGDERQAKRARRLAPDLISGLDDDVLLHILGLVADARDAVRTGALSRRWRGLWTRVPALRFASRPLPTATSAARRCDALEQYVLFVNGVLATGRDAQQSADGHTIESLTISYTTGGSEYMETSHLRRLMRSAVHATQGWMQHAFQLQRGFKSFSVDLDLPRDLYESMCLFGYDESGVMPPDDDDREDDKKKKKKKGSDPYPVVLLNVLPSSHACLQNIHLALGDARLRLPAAMRLASLTCLSLERIDIVDRDAHRLFARFVSSATCPRLRKLRLRHIWLPGFRQELRLEADELSELWVEHIHARTLQLQTPKLQSFHIDRCHSKVLRVSAPRLQEFEFLQQLSLSPRLEVIGELLSVRSLKIRLCSSEDDCVFLLKQCSSVTSHMPRHYSRLCTGTPITLNAITKMIGHHTRFRWLT
ncbi:hypothetical protein U9M48_007613 [Paspalum notatum var. saurae]|uniref:F-box domain-containing protein n=1 Tax=Paspalum notatum var. saurae TaxID=547442 RepID=A0AAQ3SML6_PASNO